MKRIGILLESMSCNRYLHETVAELASSEQIELFYLLNEPSSSGRRKAWDGIKTSMRTKGLFRTIELDLFRLLAAIERKVLSAFSRDVKDQGKILDIAEFNRNETTHLHPTFSRSKVVVRYPDEDIDAIEALSLDLILRGNAPGIFKGAILRSAREGIISFHHGDNRWNRGGPPGFWEVYLRRPSTGFVIQILTEELDGGSVIFRGDVPTKRTYRENVTALYRESYPHMARIISDFAANDGLPQPESRMPYGGPLFTAPSLPQSIAYVLRTGSLLARNGARRILLRRRARWGVAFVASTWRDATLRNGVEIRHPSNGFFADPFLAERNGRTVCFVEDYSYERSRACISAIEIVDEKRYEILGPVVEEPFHLSFPYLFEHEGELYMVPETRAERSVRLYRCREFPMKWDFERELLSSVAAVDSMVFEFGGRWWLLTTLPVREGGDRTSQLFAYYTDHPISGRWIPHDKSPLLVDSRVARNGGILNRETSRPIRCRQEQGFNAYGAALSLATITELTPSSFSEFQIGRIAPDFFRGLEGCHHMDSNGRFTVYDYVRRETLK